MGMLDDLILAIGDIGGQFSQGVARSFTQRQEEEGQLRRQKRAFETLEPLQTEAALQRRRKEFELERELGAPRREQFAKYVNPLIGEAYGEGVLPTPPEALPSPERAEFETPDYRQYLEGLDPDLALMLLRHTESKRKQDSAQEQRDLMNMFRQMGLGFQERRLTGQEERASKPPAPSQERSIAAEAERLGIPPEQRFAWEQQQRAIAAGTKAAAIADIPKPPSGKERELLTDEAATLERLDALAGLYSKDYVGPVRGRYGAAAERFGGISSEEAEFRSSVAALRNSIIKQITGAQMSENEATRIMKQIPDETNPPGVFEARLKQTRKNIALLAEKRREILGQTGVDIGKLPALPKAKGKEPAKPLAAGERVPDPKAIKLPPADRYTNKIATSKTGERYYSDGTDWFFLGSNQ